MAGVEGSLDQPPMVIRSAVWKSLLGLAGSLAFVLIGVMIVNARDATHEEGFWGWLCILFFGLGLIVFPLRILRPDRLELSPAGLKLFTVTGQWVDAPWQAISNFDTYRVRSTTMIVFDVEPAHLRRRWWAGLNRGLTGRNAGLSTGWSIGTMKLLALLQDAKARWG